MAQYKLNVGIASRYYIYYRHQVIFFSRFLVINQLFHRPMKETDGIPKLQSSHFDEVSMFFFNKGKVKPNCQNTIHFKVSDISDGLANRETNRNFSDTIICKIRIAFFGTFAVLSVVVYSKWFICVNNYVLGSRGKFVNCMKAQKWTTTNRMFTDNC